MNIYSALQKGDYHLQHNEDYLFIGETGPSRMLLAVMDGCTMGTDSYFASTFCGKLLRKIAKDLSYKQFYGVQLPQPDIRVELESILDILFRELAAAQNALLLNKDELLTTLVLLLLDKQHKEAALCVIGDGLVSVNGQITSYDQDNKPDYLGYHLGKDFGEWYAGQSQKMYVTEIKDVTIATDGIESFQKFHTLPVEAIDPVLFLTADKEHVHTEDMLSLKLKKLEHVYGLRPVDDLAMIRIICNDEAIGC